VIHTIVDTWRTVPKHRPMRASFMLAALILAGMMPLSLQADYLKNTDLKAGLAGWHGDGASAFLNSDGNEGAGGDPAAIPVIKISLSKAQPHTVYQEFDTTDTPTSLHIKVDVFASSDFKRSTFPQDYTKEWTPGGTWYAPRDFIVDVDFWIRGSGGRRFFYKLANNLKPGNWTTVTGNFQGLSRDRDRVVNFCVPPGEGTIYIKNPSVTP